MTVGRARRARARALVVPLLMSALMWVVVGEAMVILVGGPVLVVAVVILAAAAHTSVGQRWAAQLFLRARPHDCTSGTRWHRSRRSADPGVESDGLVLLVGPGNEVDVNAIDRWTVVVSRGLVESVRSGHLAAQTGAAVIAHEVGVMRAGLTHSDPGMTILLMPWKLWLTFILIMWGIAATFLPRRLMVLSLVINAGVGIWLGSTEHPVHYTSTVFMAVVLWTWWAIRSWQRARAQVGDHHLTRAGLGGAYAQFLANNYADDHTRDRAVRLAHPDLQDVRPVGPQGSPMPGVALSTTGR